MTNQIEAAIVALIQQHAVKPEIDYAELADRLHDSVCDNVDYDAIRDRAVESLDIDPSDVARHIDSIDIAGDIDLTDLASEIDLDSLANEIPMGDLATHICKDTLAEAIDKTDIIATIKAEVMRDIQPKIDEMSLLIIELNAKLAQPQPQPTTPTQMIERARNLLADALGMLSNPTA